jgi:hypothetical protein
MKHHVLTLVLLAASSLSVTSCKDVECGNGTVERDGTCAPATTTTSSGMCGPFTELQGDRCVPQFPATVCDPTTSIATIDPETGVTTCVGMSGGGCTAKFSCPAPTVANRLTVCGQLYDFETGIRFQNTDPSGAMCDPAAPTTKGPCALKITPVDAVAFSMNPATAAPLPTESISIDDCGRYRLINIDTNGTSPFIGLGIDDAGMTNGPAGVTVTTGVAAEKADLLVENFEAYIVKASTYGMWAASGGPSLATGIYVATYRKHKLVDGADRHAPQDGVTFARLVSGTYTTFAADDSYFTATQTTHQTIDGAASATGLNGTALVANRSVAEMVTFVGQGGIGSGCEWKPHAAASIPGVVFIQIFRKIDVSPGSCTE